MDRRLPLYLWLYKMKQILKSRSTKGLLKTMFFFVCIYVWATSYTRNGSGYIPYIQQSRKCNITFENVPGTDIYVYREPAFNLGHKLWKFFGVVQLTGFRGFLGNGRFYCLFKEKNGELHSAVVNVYTNPTTPVFWWYFRYQPAMFECIIPGRLQPISVSVSSTTQHPGTSFIPIMAAQSTQQPSDGVAICLQHLTSVRSSRVVAEWMEVQRLQGADRVILYGYHDVSPEVEQLLRHYVNTGFLLIQPWVLPWPSSRNPEGGGLVHTGGHQASNQDCLLRFRSRYKYLIFIDLDEYIMGSNPSIPLRYEDLFEYIEKSVGRKLNVVYFKMTHFCTNVTEILQNNNNSILSTQTYWKRENFSYHDIKISAKVIVRPGSVTAMGIHGPQWWLADDSRTLAPFNLAKLHHYKPVQGCNTVDKAMERLQMSLPLVVENALRFNPFSPRSGAKGEV